MYPFAIQKRASGLHASHTPRPREQAISSFSGEVAHAAESMLGCNGCKLATDDRTGLSASRAAVDERKRQPQLRKLGRPVRHRDISGVLLDCDGTEEAEQEPHGIEPLFTGCESGVP